MFTNQFKEATVLNNGQPLDLSLPDDDHDALLIILNVIHGHLKRVPRQITFEMLIKVAVLVDKYQFHEVMEWGTDMWTEDLKFTVPKVFTDDVIPWLCISWVFKRSTEFFNVTRVFQYQSSSGLKVGQTMGYPFPDYLINAINKGRENSLAGIIDTFKGLIEKYQGSEDTVCSHEDKDQAFRCDAMTLGMLTKRAKSIGIWPPPNPPYDGLSFIKLEDQIREMELDTLCEQAYNQRDLYNYRLRSRVPTCGIKKVSVDPCIIDLELKHHGLNLRDLTDQARKVPGPGLDQRANPLLANTKRPWVLRHRLPV
ncbi:MAG: hypothetical protein M1816_002057 [Peltula sp. TS41687]|nr:MAG: hypothetical protein M1816_002057 [Peltula sp. TS41687]